MRSFKPAVVSATRHLFAFAFVAMLGACASDTPNPNTPKVATRLDVSIKAMNDVNPDGKGRPAPIVVRVYELKNDNTFKAADFFSLQDNDKTVLADDLNAREEFLLRPGDAKAIRRAADPATTAIGILAAYRDLPKTVWRATYELPFAADARWYRRGAKVKLNIDLGADAIKVTESK